MSTPDPTPSVGMTLRAVAAWLESHPEFPAGDVMFMWPDGVVTVNAYGVGTPDDLARRADAVGGTWKTVRESGTVRLRQEIMPGVWAQFVALDSEYIFGGEVP